MPRIDDLPPDRRAVLGLLLQQGRGYEDIAGMLRISPDAVRERARDALDQLGPSDGAGLSLERQDEVSDYLLGQQTASQRAQTRTFLEGSAAGRAWARVVAGELRAGGLGEALPEVPAEGPEVDEAFGALEARKAARARQQRSSRLGGVLLLGAVGAAIAFFVVFVVSGSNDSGDSGPPTVASAPRTAPPAQTTADGAYQVLGQANLRAPKGRALAVVQFVKQGDVTALAFQGQRVPAPPRGSAYALWLDAAGSAPRRLGFYQPPNGGAFPKDGRVAFTARVPAGIDVSRYSQMIVSRETTANPPRPTRVVLNGPIVHPGG